MTTYSRPSKQQGRQKKLIILFKFNLCSALLQHCWMIDAKWNQKFYHVLNICGVQWGIEAVRGCNWDGWRSWLWVPDHLPRSGWDRPPTVSQGQAPFSWKWANLPARSVPTGMPAEMPLSFHNADKKVIPIILSKQVRKLYQTVSIFEGQ